MIGLENLTLTEADLDSCRPQAAQGGAVIRAFCPYHGSDRQRSLKVTVATGRFHCFACGAWGYTEQAREKWRGRQVVISRPQHYAQKARTLPMIAKVQLATETATSELVNDDRDSKLFSYQKALPASPGERYLASRRIALSLAQDHGLGYAAAGSWCHRARDWKGGRLVFPHSDPDGRLVNLYGRAVGDDARIPKESRHDHLPGRKGYFNARAIGQGSGPLFVCEGAFDALSLIAAGYSRTVAIFGLGGWRWDWMKQVESFVLAFDADAAGSKGWREVARQACLRGKRVAFLPPAAYGGCKDANEAWVARSLDVGVWPGDPPAAWDLPYGDSMSDAMYEAVCNVDIARFGYYTASRRYSEPAEAPESIWKRLELRA